MAGSAANGAAPSGLSVVAHPLRWALLRQLTSGDHRVRELVAAVGEPQNLVSYHLGLLRSSGLVSARRSSADGRETYYRASVAGCAQLLVDAGRALHPALRLSRQPASLPSPPVTGRVLFLCTGNSARSKMAEALTDQLSGGAVTAASAGSHPGRLHPNSVKVMRHYGIDLSGREPVHLGAFIDERFDYVITLCDRVREICPEFPGAGRRLHWSMPNPAEAGDTDRATYPAFEQAAAELADRIPLLLHLMTEEEVTA
jgi:ArsR family transcriptional regulator, arsenate/arsenite/antimonite-responsive transcriptional repressor / arsenate reductase (thioredoxin)